MHVLVSASNPGFLFWILSRSFGEKLIFLQSCETKSGMKSLGSRLLVSCPGHVHLLAKKQSSALSRLSWFYPQNVGVRYDDIHSYVCGHSPGWKPNIILLCSITAFEALLPLNFHQGWGSHAFHRYIRYSYVHPVTLSNA